MPNHLTPRKLQLLLQLPRCRQCKAAQQVPDYTPFLHTCNFRPSHRSVGVLAPYNCRNMKPCAQLQENPCWHKKQQCGAQSEPAAAFFHGLVGEIWSNPIRVTRIVVVVRVARRVDLQEVVRVAGVRRAQPPTGAVSARRLST